MTEASNVKRLNGYTDPPPATFKDIKADDLEDKWWRLNNLYWIIDKYGKKVLFRCNDAQKLLFEKTWYMNLILKDRQRGMTTFIDLYILDDVLFYPDLEAGIIAHREADAIKIFRRKIKYPYDNLYPELRDRFPLITKRNDELAFPNNSYVYVSTSMRSGTVQRLHLSEFGIVCAKFPDKAREVVSGSLEAIHPGSIVFIESTAEGREGYFYEYCKDAEKIQQSGRRPTALEWNLFFLGWTSDPDKRLSTPVPLSAYDNEYFRKVERSLGIKLDNEQRWWYAAKRKLQRDAMKKENPATVQEAFEAAIEGAYYVTELSDAREQGRITMVPHKKGIRVDTWWDLGWDDSTSIWFTQTVGRQIHVIDYYENNNESLLHYAKTLYDKASTGGWMFGRHTGPHDTMKHELGTGKTLKQQAAELEDSVTKKNYSFIFRAANRINYQQEGIEAVRSILSFCWFDEENTTVLFRQGNREREVGLPSLENYRKEYDEKKETFRNNPLHNWACLHGDTMIRTLSGWKPIKDLVGQAFYVWVYDFNERRLRPAEAKRCWKSKTTNETVKVNLDHNRFIQCTHNHLFLLRDSSWKRAADLMPGESLMPFYEKLDRGYPKIHLTDGSIAEEHKFVYSLFCGYLEKGRVVHHKDSDKYNNNPDNLEKMTIRKHISIHASEPGRLAKLNKNKGNGSNRASTEHLIRMNKSRGDSHHSKDPEFWTKEIRDKIGSGSHLAYKRSEEIKICPACKGEFLGNWKRIYCCYKCVRRAQSIRRGYSLEWSKWDHAPECLLIEKQEPDGNNHKVTNVEFINDTIDVYDIEVPIYHNFVAENVVVHNSHGAKAFETLAITHEFKMISDYDDLMAVAG